MIPQWAISVGGLLVGLMAAVNDKGCLCQAKDDAYSKCRKLFEALLAWPAKDCTLALSCSESNAQFIVYQGFVDMTSLQEHEAKLTLRKAVR